MCFELRNEPWIFHSQKEDSTTTRKHHHNLIYRVIVIICYAAKLFYPVECLTGEIIISLLEKRNALT